MSGTGIVGGKLKLKGDDEALHRFCESDIDSLLRGAAEDVTAGREAAGGSTFARASFMPQAAGAEEELLLDDPNFWSKLQRIQQHGACSVLGSDGAVAIDGGGEVVVRLLDLADVSDAHGARVRCLVLGVTAALTQCPWSQRGWGRP